MRIMRASGVRSPTLRGGLPATESRATGRSRGFTRIAADQTGLSSQIRVIRANPRQHPMRAYRGVFSQPKIRATPNVPKTCAQEPPRMTMRLMRAVALPPPRALWERVRVRDYQPQPN